MNKELLTPFVEGDGDRRVILYRLPEYDEEFNVIKDYFDQRLEVIKVEEVQVCLDEVMGVIEASLLELAIKESA